LAKLDEFKRLSKQGGDEAPNSNIQAPEKLQGPNSIRNSSALGTGSLEFGISLELGAWDLELLTSCGMEKRTDKNHRDVRYSTANKVPAFRKIFG